jgi:quaternary ammonium compound-resistance protein SugE
MGWVTLVFAGLVEIAWSQSIKPTENFTRPWPTLLCFVLGAAAVYLLSRAMDTVPVGTAYAVFTGIGAVGAIVLGAVGAIVLGVVVTKDPLSVGRVAALALIVGGVVLARVTS